MANEKMKYIIIGVVVAIIALFVWSAITIDTSDLQVRGVQDISLEGFILNAQITISNSGIPLYVSNINYEVYEEGELLAQGAIAGGVVGRGDTVFPLTIEGEWRASAESALRYVWRDEFPVTLVVEPSIFGISSSTSIETDLKAEN